MMTPISLERFFSISRRIYKPRRFAAFHHGQLIGNSGNVDPIDRQASNALLYTGTGKTTTGAALANLLGVPHISLDELYWQPGWREATREEFQAKIRERLTQSDRGWIVDGDYEDKSGNFVAPETTDIIWLDPPLLLYFPRIFYRTMLRLLGLRKPCSPGCPERLSETFSKRGILWWCLSNHWRVRRKVRARIAEVGSGANLGGQKMRRLGGWGGEVKRWLKEVEMMCHMRGKGVLI